MIAIDQITVIPSCLPWSKFAKSELENHPNYLRLVARQSKEIYLLRDAEGKPIMVLGVAEASMITGFRMWCLMCNNDLRKHCRVLKRLLHMYVQQIGHVTVTVDKTFSVGQRFAEFMGFDLCDEITSIENKQYLVYEMSK